MQLSTTTVPCLSHNIKHIKKQEVPSRTHKAYLPDTDLKSYKYCVAEVMFRYFKFINQQYNMI